MGLGSAAGTSLPLDGTSRLIGESGRAVLAQLPSTCTLSTAPQKSFPALSLDLESPESVDSSLCPAVVITAGRVQSADTGRTQFTFPWDLGAFPGALCESPSV